MHTFEWPIEDITAAYPGLRLDDYAAMTVSLMKESAPPYEFLVEIRGFDIDELGDKECFVLQLTWSETTERAADAVARTRQRSQIVEGAAVGMAFLLFAHLIPESEMKLTVAGDRADFWLPRLHEAIEVSGTEDARQMKRRSAEKSRQILENSRGWNGYVVLCCFDPSQRMVQWSYHSQGE